MNTRTTSVSIAVSLFGILLHLVIPAIAALAVALFFMALTVGEIYKVIAEATGFFLLLQCVAAFGSSVLFGVSSAILFERLRSGWVYPGVIALSLTIHFLFLGSAIAGWYIAYSRDLYPEILRYNFYIALTVAPILGLTAIVSNMIAGRIWRGR